jgi:hypothetical protein
MLKPEFERLLKPSRGRPEEAGSAIKRKIAAKILSFASQNLAWRPYIRKAKEDNSIF